MYYARIVVRVSSNPQADGVSPEEQLTNSRAAIPVLSRQLGIDIIEWTPPLITVQSTDILDIDALGELRRQNADYDHLCHQVQTGQLHFVIGRDVSRVLGRTEQIQSQFGSFLRMHGVQLYYYNQPAALKHPSHLDPRRRADFTSRMVETLHAAAAEEEVSRLVHRKRTVMQAYAEAGIWRMAPPAGYARDLLAVLPSGRKVYGDLYINHNPTRGFTKAQLIEAATRYVNGESSTVLGISLYGAIIAPAGVGVMVYNQAPRKARPDKRGVIRSLATYQISPQRASDLGEAFLDGIDARTKAEKEGGLIVSRLTTEREGERVPIAVFETPEEVALWRSVQARRRSRFYNRGRTKLVHPLSGLVYCQVCGESLLAVERKYYPTRDEHSTIYRCRTWRMDKNACIPNTMHESDLLEEVFTALELLATDKAALIKELRRPSTRPLSEKWEAQKRRAANALKNLDLERKAALEADEPLSAETAREWREQKRHYEAQFQEAQRHLATQDDREPDPSQRADEIIRTAASLRYHLQQNPRYLEAWFNRHIRQVLVHQSRVTELKLT